MRVFLIAPGIADYCVEYANALALKADVTMAAPQRFFRDQARYVNKAVDLRLLDWPPHRSLRNILFIRAIAPLIEQARPDVVHFLSEGVIWLNLILPLVKKYGLVTTMHDVSYHMGDHQSRRVPRFCVNWLLRRSDRIIVHGAVLRAEAEAKYPDLQGRLAVLPHLPLQRYAEVAQQADMSRQAGAALTILFFGRILAYKGVDILIKCIPQVTSSHGNIRVVIAGSGEDMENYRGMITDPEVFDVRNRFIPDDETAQLFTDADIVVLPYIEASQSGVLAIANAFAKPVIVTDVGELGATVQNGVTGLVIPPGNTAALAEAILKLAQDDALRMQLGLAGQAAAAMEASPSSVAESAMTLYRQVISCKPVRS